MVTVRNTTLSQLCTRPLERSSSSTKRFQHMGHVQRSHLPGSGKLLQSEIQHQQYLVQVGIEKDTNDVGS